MMAFDCDREVLLEPSAWTVSHLRHLMGSVSWTVSLGRHLVDSVSYG